MDRRPSRTDSFMAIAMIMAARGTCQRNQVGVVITSYDYRIISTGYNGPLTEDICFMKCEDLTKGCQHAIHAEANAIAAAAKHGIKLNESIMYCTHSPCLKCAELIIQSGIRTFYYKESYRLMDGLFLLKKNGVEVFP